MKVDAQMRAILKMALQEDIGTGDITTRSLLPKNPRRSARIIAREKGILCGSEAVRTICKMVDKRITVTFKKHDGERIKKNDIICMMRGPIHGILKSERVALNYVGYLSGISTMTNRYVQEVRSTRAHIYDTRKTIPGYRLWEKYAVITGGGYNQRIGLYDQVLIKDNHYQALGKRACRNITPLITRVRRRIPQRIKIQIEADSLALLKQILPAHPDYILLDNMKPQTLKKAIALIRAENRKQGLTMKIEASGGITLKNVRHIAQLGVDRISIGAITHSAHNLDFSLEVL